MAIDIVQENSLKISEYLCGSYSPYAAVRGCDARPKKCPAEAITEWLICNCCISEWLLCNKYPSDEELKTFLDSIQFGKDCAKKWISNRAYELIHAAKLKDYDNLIKLNKALQQQLKEYKNAESWRLNPEPPH